MHLNTAHGKNQQMASAESGLREEIFQCFQQSCTEHTACHLASKCFRTNRIDVQEGEDLKT